VREDVAQYFDIKSSLVEITHADGYHLHGMRDNSLRAAQRYGMRITLVSKSTQVFEYDSKRK
jgi:hypothetical protein